MAQIPATSTASVPSHTRKRLRSDQAITWTIMAGPWGFPCSCRACSPCPSLRPAGIPRPRGSCPTRRCARLPSRRRRSGPDPRRREGRRAHRRVGQLPRGRGIPAGRREGHGEHARHEHGNPQGPAMIVQVIAWSLRNRFLVWLGTLAVLVAGIWAIRATPLDALPDLSDVQVVIQTDFSEQAPQIVEDQVTYSIASEMLKVPGERVVRGYSFFGLSLVYVLFQDGTDLYWARSRVLDYLNGIRGRLPPGVEPALGPD